jgi:hypothetical protein
MIRNIIRHISAAAALLASAAPAANASALQATDSLARDWREHTQFNALDYRLQRPAARRSFPDSVGGYGHHRYLTIDGAPTWLGNPAGLAAHDKTGWRATLSGGDWFTPAHGLRLGLELGQHRVVSGDRTLFAGVALDYTLNFTGLLRGSTDHSPVEFIGTAGPEVQLVRANQTYNWAYGARVGLQVRWNVTPCTFIYVEPRMGLYNDGIDRTVGWKRVDWQGSIALGIGYRVNSWHIQFHHSTDAPFHNRSFTDNMWIGAAGGLATPGTNHTKHHIGGHLGGQGSIFIGKWFSGLSGWRLGLNVGNFYSPSHLNRDFVLGDLDYLFNPINALGGYRQNPKFDTNFILGVSAGSSNLKRHRVSAGVAVGIQEVWNVNDAFAIFLEPKLRMMTRNFNYGAKVSTDRQLEPFITLSLGFVYKIGGAKERIDVMTAHYADPDVYRSSHRWFVNIQGGCFTRHKHWAGNGVVTGTSVGRWISPVMAWRLGGDLEYCTLAPRMAQWQLNADLMLSLTNLTMDYDPQRRLNVGVFAGVEGGVAVYRSTSHGRIHGVAGVRGGVHLEARLSSRVGLFVEPQIHVWRAPGYLSSQPLYCPELRATAGLSYKF